MSMESILSASTRLATLRPMQSANTKAQGQANVLKAEIKLEGGNKKKEKQVEDIEEKLSANMSNMLGKLTDVNTELEPPTEDELAKEESKKEPQTDRVEISANGKEASASGEVIPDKIQVGEPVTYKPEGNAINVTRQFSAEKQSAKAE